MTKPDFRYWRFEYRHSDGHWKTLTHYGHRPTNADDVREIRELYDHQTPPIEQKPAAWSYSWAWGEVLTRVDPTGRKELGQLRDLRPLYEHPAPQPATDPAVEAARRKALRAIFNILGNLKHESDSGVAVVHMAVLRDLTGQPRKFSGLVPGYDDEPDLKVSAPMHETARPKPSYEGSFSAQNIPIWPTHVAESQVPKQEPEQPVQPQWGNDITQQAKDAVASATAMPSWALQSVDDIAQALEARECGPAGPMWPMLSEWDRKPWRDRARKMILRAASVVPSDGAKVAE